MLEEKIKQAVWASKTLFNLGKTSGSTGNISFREGNNIFISRSGSCFGTMTENDFSILDLEGNVLNEKVPSKEYPIHLSYYKKFQDVQAVIHTHGRYGVLWSCMQGLEENDCIPTYTPYLKMKLGAVRLVPYEQPGSRELFKSFEAHMGVEKGYLLKRHGALVGAKSIMDAFYAMEELEESAFIAWNLKNTNQQNSGIEL